MNKLNVLNEKGNVSIFLCLIITAIFGFTAFAIDIGFVYVEKSKLSNAVDSAALAAVMELPNDTAKAKQVALDYLAKNDVAENEATINFSSDNKSIIINASKDVTHLFAPIIGINSSNVQTNTKAIIAPISTVKNGIRPFAVVAYNFSYGDLVTLKQGAGSGYNGNYYAVALGGTGASVFQNNALYGYNGYITVGSSIDTETGNMAGATNAISNYINTEHSTFYTFQRNSIRIWTLPLVDTLTLDGRKSVHVVGFAEFYVESVGNKSGNMELSGRFLRYVINGPVDPTINDTGLYGAKLSK